MDTTLLDALGHQPDDNVPMMLANLCRSQRIFELIISHIPQAVFWKDRNSIYMGCNAVFARYAGLSHPDQIVGKSDYELPWTTEQAAAYIRDDQEVMHSNQPKLNIIERQRQADGKQGWVDTNKVPLQDDDGNVIGVLGTYEDFTEFKQARDALYRAHEELEARVLQRTAELSAANAKLKQEIKERERVEEALRVSQARYALAVSAGQVGIMEWTPATGEMFFDESLKTILDAPHPAHMHPTLDNLLSCVHPEDRERVQRAMLAYVRDHAAHYEQGYRVVSRSGEVRWVLARCSAITDANGRAIRITGSITDVTALKRAEQAEIRQRTFSEALVETAKVLNSSLDLDLVLDRILSEISRVVPHDTANIVLIDPEDGSISVVRRQGRGGNIPANTTPIPHMTTLEQIPNFRQMMQTAQPVLIDNTLHSPKWVERKRASWVRSYLGAPIRLEHEVIGFINLNSATPGFFRDVHVRQLQAFTEQAGIAIRNARLYASAQQLAALEERQRLARDLHDAVSQTLWTASLTADVLPLLWEQDRERVGESLERLKCLTRGALAEMRTLLLELRPSALVEASLGDLLQRLAEATMSRKKLDIQIQLSGSTNAIPEKVHITLYRIAQECLNNVTKHARAQSVTIRLDATEDSITLDVCDDGRGFDPQHLPTGRLGLRIMRERAQTVGASFDIATRPGHGTRVRVCYPLEEESSDGR